MSRINAAPAPALTHEGGRASRTSPMEELRRTVLTCLLWEDTFYEKGDSVAKRIAALVAAIGPKNPGAIVALALDARSKYQLRHAPLFLIRELARCTGTPGVGVYVEHGLLNVIQRADELAEFLSIYWKDGKCPLAASVKRGLAAAFTKFNEYELAKWNRTDKAVKLRDVLFLCHAKPLTPRTGFTVAPAIDKRVKEVKMSGSILGSGYQRGVTMRDTEGQGALWKRLVDGTLETPDTWEVALSAGADKRATWERLITEGKLGGMAVLKNLRNMQNAGVPTEVIAQRLYAGCGRALPFRFITAARYAPKLEEPLEAAMLRGLADMPMLEGTTGLLVDVSGSMDCPAVRPAPGIMPGVEQTSRIDVAGGLAILLREKASDFLCATFSNKTVAVPPRRGFALRDAIRNSQEHSSTYLRRSLEVLHRDPDWAQLERLIVITDEQSSDGIAEAWLPKSYVVNVASYAHGVGYDKGWMHISGWSDRVVDYIREIEAFAAEGK